MSRPWQRQSDEPPADFNAFVAYLRLKGRRSLRLVATQTGRPPGAIRRLSAQFNWPARVAAFEARLADASQDALGLLLRAADAHASADSQQLREGAFKLAERVLNEAHRWLKLAVDPRRRDVTLGQVCCVIALASKLGRVSAGLPTGEESRRRPRKEDAPGFWTGPSVEEALDKIYGQQPSAAADPTQSAATCPPVSESTTSPDAPANGHGTAASSVPVASHSPATDHSVPASPNAPPAPAQPPADSTPSPPPEAGPERPRRDAWSSWARLQRRPASN